MKNATEVDATELIPPNMVERALSLQDVFDLGREKLNEFILYWTNELNEAKNKLQVFMDTRPSAWISWTPDARFGASPEYANFGRYNKPTFSTFNRNKLDEGEKKAYDLLKSNAFDIQTKLINLVSLREIAK